MVDDDVYAADDKAVRENAFEHVLSKAFALAGVDYGRADFGLVDGRPQIYEINTNPFIGELKPHPSAIRQGSLEFARARFLRDLASMDGPSEGEMASIELAGRQDSKYVVDELRAHLRDPREKIAALQAEIAAFRAEAARKRPSVERASGN